MVFVTSFNRSKQYGLYLVLVMVIASTKGATQGQPSQPPFLQIETGMHTGSIFKISIDSANRYLVTASPDKTARVWDVETSRMIRVIRVPMGRGDEGRLYAVAISPDGNTIAVAGNTSHDGLNENIFLFDRESGRMKNRIGGLPTRVRHLLFSPTGQFLAATLHGNHGVRLFSVKNNELVGADEDYGGDSFAADFDRSGRLATTSYDGNIRLYNIGPTGSLNLLKKRLASGGTQPVDIRFSPDGARLAIGYEDSPVVSVLRSDTLSQLSAPSNTGISPMTLNSVAWGPDGKTLYAGGRVADANGVNLIRRWNTDARLSFRDIAIDSKDTVMHMLALRDGRVVFATADPALGIINISGKASLIATSQIDDYRDTNKDFSLTEDGRAVWIDNKQFGQKSLYFSISERKLAPQAKPGAKWLRPVTENDIVRVTDWFNSREPKIDGRKLKIEDNETARSLSFAPDKSVFLLGTEWKLRLFDRLGQSRWDVSAPAPAWAVNISANGLFAVAAHGDGTIRWYSMRNGKELIAVYPHTDGKVWVAWTPSGYFDAAPGGEGLVGWHVNYGMDQAAGFYPVSQFRDRYYRPDILVKVLETLDEELAIKEANVERAVAEPQASIAEMLPPDVEIISPKDGEVVVPGEITVRYRVRSRTGEPIITVTPVIDGVPAQSETGLRIIASGPGLERQIKLRMPAGASNLSLIAGNRYAHGVAPFVKIETSPRRGTEIVGGGKQPRRVERALYVLAIGIDHYKESSGLRSLRYASKDARDIAKVWKEQTPKSYKRVETLVLPTKQNGEIITRDEIMEGLEWISSVSAEQDVSIIFLAGHGVNDGNSFYYFMPSDADVKKPSVRGVSFSEIENTIKRIKGRRLLFVDTCRSAGVLGERGVIDVNGIVNGLSSAEVGGAVFTASLAKESAEESAALQNGAFTYALIEALQGKAGFNKDGELTFSLLEEYLYDRVRELTEGRQTPSATKPVTVSNFALAVVK